ncbi:MAG: anti-sigma factor, partial [Dehalococcoidia bacterium]|nr:anti-sigma factor [Dehalococcoidia bacterium]
MTRRFPILAATLVALALVGTMLIPSGTALANGVPVPVALKYIDLSNWGPEDASGNAELMFAEGILRLEASGLERLSGRLYQVWLVNSEAGDAISAGRFNAAADGSVDFTGTLPPLSDFGFDLLILTVEPEPDDAPQPTEDRSIGGYFSLVGQ